jgi:ubiquinone/menaquinone biosynthesis C-methylase UbiE
VKKMNDIKEFWNTRTKKYGHTGWSNSFIYAYDQQARLMAVEKILNSLSFNTSLALDFGTGSGDFAGLLAKYFESVIAFDISDAVIRKAKKKYGQIKNIQFIGGNNIEEIGIPFNTVDVILTVTVLDHIMADCELTKILKYFERLLNEKGIIVAFEYALNHKKSPTSYQRFMQLEDWRTIFLNCGFSLDKSYGFYHPSEDPCESYLSYKSHTTGIKGKMLRLLAKVHPEFANKYLNKLASRYLLAKNDFWGENRPGSSPLKIMIFRKVK